MAGISTTPPVEIMIRVLSTQGVCKSCLFLPFDACFLAVNCNANMQQVGEDTAPKK